MLKKFPSLLASVLFSSRMMAFLFIVYAFAMARGTFIEDQYNTETARIIIYNAWWFEAIHIFFLINFFGNIKRYQLYRREKWATLLLHLSFILIIAGAAVTRYISFEGMMPIREGAASNQFYSDRAFLTVFVDGNLNGEMLRKVKEKGLLLSQATNNDFTISDKFGDKPFEVSYENFIMNAKEVIKPSKEGPLYLKLVESEGGGRHEHYLKEGEVQNIHNLLFALNKPTPGAININTTGEVPTIQSPFSGDFMRMADQLKGPVVENTEQPLMMRSLYNLGGSQFVFPDPPAKGALAYESNNDYKDKMTDDVLAVRVKSEGKEKVVMLSGSKGKVGEPVSFKMGSLEYTLMYGSKIYTLPFQIKLNDFIAKRYPGTEKSYSSFESKVTVLDADGNFDAHIYMNNILDHKGYRFFQAQFDEDEKGTILSVNHDSWGTWITYIGYFLLYFAMMAILFDKNTRFAELKKKLAKLQVKKAKGLAMLLLLFGFSGFAQDHEHTPGDGHDHSHESTAPAAAAPKRVTQHQIDSILGKYTIAEKHASQFGRLILQDAGRMKPINTFSSELLRKVSKSDSYKGMNSDQVFLSMVQYPRLWFEIPIIYIKKGNDSIRHIIGIGKDEKYAAFRDFFDSEGNYKLSPYLDAAYKAAVPNQFEKDFKTADEKVNLLNAALSGSILKIFPYPNDANNKWVSHLELSHATGTTLDTVRLILPAYLNALTSASETGDYTRANTLVVAMDDYQHKFGSKVMPSADRVTSEILYNKYDVFRNLFWLYMMFGSLMLLVTIVNILIDKKSLRLVSNIFHVIIGILFGIHTLGLIARWYISGHAPWSDAYESMIYVAWATMFFTLAFDRKSKLTVASGTFVASMILMIAHWNWMDPSIANLQPVLNSYWLMIHVAVIVASYGPFTLAMVLGVVTLILMLFATKSNKDRMKMHIKEITYINEMALTIGLVMLTIGNFLGGQWANESWGRYWGWDPKETWALISIMVYAFVIHARFVPGLRGKWIYNLLSIIAFYSIMMTYFGVNFYLTGLHSYASGDQVVTPVEFYYSLVILALLAGFSYWRYRKFLR